MPPLGTTRATEVARRMPRARAEHVAAPRPRDQALTIARTTGVAR
ncbi:hypothetical protein DB32_000313 [Sandaracinus amylolyticus]|uniref:Uncharacterized protein n=1 Tax=Sandaracinus amylolyticus TaxID=927083 RepID=A0A0F6SDB7_9BACT|nr:hypothetical protein DB32_000313 [Sandaracinus amylolyticus]